MSDILNKDDYKGLQIQVLNIKLNAVFRKSAEAGDNADEIRNKLIDYLTAMDIDNINDRS